MFPNPKQCIAHLNLSEGMRVADFGSGSGHYVKALSDVVGHTGKVYAIEIQKGLVKKLESEIKSFQFENVECIWGNIESFQGSKLADESVNAVVIANVLFQTDDKLGLVDEARRILKKNGEVLLVDWSDESDMAPGGHTVSAQKAQDLFKQRGFKTKEIISPSGHHYGIIFKHE